MSLTFNIAEGLAKCGRRSHIPVMMNYDDSGDAFSCEHHHLVNFFIYPVLRDHISEELMTFYPALAGLCVQC